MSNDEDSKIVQFADDNGVSVECWVGTNVCVRFSKGDYVINYGASKSDLKVLPLEKTLGRIKHRYEMLFSPHSSIDSLRVSQPFPEARIRAWLETLTTSKS